MKIAALVLAAGQSTRMGQPKPLLSWGTSTVIEHVVATLFAATVDVVVVVTGNAHARVADALAATPAQLVFNPNFATNDMLASVKIGLSALDSNVEATFVALADQPMMTRATILAVLATRRASGQNHIVAPSFQGRRGHPILLPRVWWPAVHALQPPETLRTFLRAHTGQIVHVETENSTIFDDIDTRDAYEKHAQHALESQS